MIRLDLEDREARALMQAVGLLREALQARGLDVNEALDAAAMSDPGEGNALGSAHLKLTAALERQEEHAP